jgi:hypothetical protein
MGYLVLPKMVKSLIVKAQKHGHGGLRINVPSKIHYDSLNPIVAGEDIKITVDGKRMIITPIRSTPHHTLQQEDKIAE